MGFFGKLKTAKDDYVQREAARQREMQENHEKKQKAKEDRERALYQKLESSELIQDLIDWVSLGNFGESQGNLDTNRRQFLVGYSMIVVNNYPNDILSAHIDWMGIDNGEISYRIHREKPGKLLGLATGGTAASMEEEWYIKTLRSLEEFKKNPYLYAEAFSLDKFGYEHIEERMLRPVTTVLRDKLRRMYPRATFTEIRWNQYCAFVFEMILPPTEKRSIF